jgi:beta-lactamase regulating signal transducer with metallopeptidase domain/protein involved in polysaccharide export with SLBB domain
MVPFIADHIWQSTLFAGAAAILVWTMRGCPARVRHAIWTAASIKFLIPFSLLIGFGAYVKPASAPDIMAAPVVSAAIEQISQPFSRTEPYVAIDAANVGAGFSRPDAQSTMSVPASWTTYAGPIFAAIWLAGALLLTLWRVRGWRQIAATARAASQVTDGAEFDLMTHVAGVLRVRPRVRLVRSIDMAEPAVLGIFRPRLLWPAALTERLVATDIEPILVHELQHVRRRDNLIALVHMAVETIFWCHPIVWWLGARMVRERELACDEAVIAYGAGRTQYAESLLAVCRLCLASPVRCVSGVSGWNLKHRVEAILTATPRQLALTRKLLLGAAMAVALLGPLAVGFLQARPLTIGTAVETMLSPATTLMPAAAAPTPTPAVPAAANDPIPATDPRPRSLTGRPLDWAAFPTQTLSPAPPAPNDHVVQKSDLLRIQSTFSNWVRTVEPDGTIAFPSLGTLKIEGMTSRQVEALIERGLNDKGLLGARDRILVEVSGAQNAASPPASPTRSAQTLETVFVNGEVRTPGSTQLKSDEMTLMHGLANAGGPTAQAGQNIIVLRPRPLAPRAVAMPLNIDSSTAQRFVYSRKQLMERMEDPPIEAGDTIWVEQAEMFIINGEVKAGGIKVWEPRITVGDAINMAGGMTDKSGLSRSHIQRKNDKGTFDNIRGLRLETPILPKDVVVIGRKLF